jgi:hypothetical protein
MDESISLNHSALSPNGNKPNQHTLIIERRKGKRSAEKVRLKLAIKEEI